MIYRTLIDGDSVTVQVEDEDGVLFIVPASDRADAVALVKKAVKDGHDAIRPEEKPVNKKAK